jgi:uncharacterized membrane protein YbhN (UPF0104 family)
VARRSKALVPAVQALASVAVLVLLVRQAALDELSTALTQASWGWLAVACVGKTLGLTLHEVRLWVSLLPGHRRPVWAVVLIGYAAGLVNTVLPMRSGDMFAVVLLRTEQDVPAPAAISAVALTAILEAVAFGLFLLGVLVFGAAHFDELLGTASANRATGAVGLLALGSLAAAVVTVLIARRFGEEPREPGPGLVAGLKSTLVATGDHLRRPGLALSNLALAFGQVLALLVTFWCLLPAVGIDLGLPLLAVSGILAVGSLASIALPPTMAAGPAAVSVFVLGFFGVGEAQALAYAAMSWVVNVVPALAVGAVPLWGRLGRLGELALDEPAVPISEP